MPRLYRETNPRWLGGEREKVCQHCGKTFQWNGEPYSWFKKRKFCSKACIVAGQKRYYGSEHPRYNPNARKRFRTGKRYVAWQTAVFSRDRATCRHCGATDIQLHAHHIKSWKDFPDLRFDVDNGLTLCYRCHLVEHSAGIENPVNSVDTREGNTEPSLDGNILEGVTTRGRAYRRVVLHCEWCGVFLTKAVGKAKQAKHHFCCKQCAGKYKAANRTWRRWKNPDKPMAVTSSTSAGAERQDIV